MSDAAVETPLSVPPEVVKNYPVWICDFKLPQEKLTAGSIWQMQCHGDQDVELNPPLTVQFPKDEQSYALQILEVQKLATRGGDFVVTGYRPGDYQPSYIVITDTKSAVRVDGLKWNINSVIEKQQGKPPEAFPPYGPFTLALPWWYQALFYGFGIAVVLAAAVMLFALRQKRKTRNKLLKLNSSLTPYMQFHKQVRALDGQKDLSSELERILQIYVSRRFQFYAIGLKPERMIKKIKHKASSRQYEMVSNLFVELKSLKDRALEPNDREQFILMTQKAVDELEKSL